MSTLLLRLAAPMQSWGIDSKFDTRNTQKEPTKSGVLGLLAGALGISRQDTISLEELSQLRFGVRVDRAGKLQKDFHTARKDKKTSYITYRYYLYDAVFLCGLESENRELLERYAYALTHPVYPLFLGRRSCPPTLPLVMEIQDLDLETALKQHRPLCDKQAQSPIYLMIEVPPTDPSHAMIRDLPLSFSPIKREYGHRKYKEIILKAENDLDHDAYAEVEESYVSDTNGA